MSKNFEVYSLKKSGVDVALSVDSSRGSTSSSSGNSSNDKFPWAPWYNNKDSKLNNLEPDNIITTILSNNITPGILNTQVNFICGSGIVLGRVIVEKGKKRIELVDDASTKQIYDYLESIRANHFLRYAATNLKWFGNVFAEFIMSRNGKRVATMKCLDSSSVRLQKMNAAGRIDNAYICGEYSKVKSYDPSDKKNKQVTVVPMYDASNERKSKKYIMHLKHEIPGQPYYSLPLWYGTMNWIKLANEIPLWHLSGMRNGYNIKYLVRIPESYFADFPPEQIESKKEEIRNMLDECLSGSDNVDKAIITFKSGMINATDEWEIIPLQNNINDAAFTALFEQSNFALLSGHSLDPSLSGIETQGKLSSGSDKRISYQAHLALKTPSDRRVLLEPFKHIWRMNGFDQTIVPVIEDTELTTLDMNPTGTQKSGTDVTA